METWFAWMWIAVALMRLAFRERAPVTIAARPETLCRTCVNAHLVKGFRGKELISCTFGGSLRRMKFEVRECTGFSDRLVSIAPVRVVGFVREENEVYAEVRIS